MIIGFSASMGAGKTTAVEYLRAFHSTEHKFKPVFNVKFAQPLYDMQDFVYTRISSTYKKPDGFVKDRKLLQWLGTEWGRNTISETLWVDLWRARVLEHQSATTNAIVVCDDVRFNNEAEILRSLGGYVVKINCDKTDKRIDTAAGIKQHSSEAGINSKLVDYEITNNGTLNEFKLSLRNLYGLIEHRMTYKL